jgi:lipoate-protein ligase B
VKIQRGVTMHGLAVNVTMDLSPFQLVTPCGIEQCRVTSMGAVLGYDVPMDMVRRRMAEMFGEVFGIDWTEWITDVATIRQRWQAEKPVQAIREFADESDE